MSRKKADAERQYADWLAGELAARIKAEHDPEADALDAIGGVLAKLPLAARRRVLSRLIAQSQLKGE